MGQLAQEFSSPYTPVQFIEHSVWSEGRAEPRIAFNFPSFQEFIKKHSYGKDCFMVDEISEIKKVTYEGWVYDLTIDHPDHNFIANQFVVSNCGVRLLTTPLIQSDVQDKIKDLVVQLFKNIPSGVGSRGFHRFSKEELKKITKKGARWAIEHGFGVQEDLAHIEEEGCLESAAPELLSDHALERGKDQLGTLGSGNHFLEIGVVQDIYRPHIAEAFGLFKDQITIMIHSGSRGLGHQVCTDYLHTMQKALQKYKISVPDRQLACAPISSQEGQDYLGSMAAAANFAWANRQLMMHRARDVMQRLFGISFEEMVLLFDVCHNIAKFEEYEIDGQMKKLCVHRKGATRAFAPHHPKTPKAYQETGQPVIVPGDMGRYSFVLVGTEKAMHETFGSSCHGAGRMMSRTQALREARGRALYRELEDQGVYVMSKGQRTLAEEMPAAYKDVASVVDSMDAEGITLKVAKIKPIGCIKG